MDALLRHHETAQIERVVRVRGYLVSPRMTNLMMSLHSEQLTGHKPAVLGNCLRRLVRN